MKFMRWLLRGLLGLVTLSLVLLSISGYLLYTQQGTRWLFALVQHFAPGELQAQQINGRLAGPLDIQGLDYRQDDLHLAAQQLRLDWHPARLLQRELHISELALHGTRLTLPASETTEPEPGQAPITFDGIALPVALRLDSIQVGDFQITPATGPAQTLGQLTLAAYAEGEQIRIQNIHAKGFGADVKVQGELGLAAELPLDIKLAWRYQLPDGPELQGAGQVTGNLKQLQIQQNLAAPLNTQLQAEFYSLLKEPRWQAKLDLQQADLSAFAPTLPAWLGGQISSQGNLAEANAQAEIAIDKTQYGDLALKLQANYAGQKINLATLRLTIPDSKLQLDATGAYALDGTNALQVNLNWRELRWPLQGDAVQIRSPQGQAKVRGQLDDYQFNLALDAELPAVAPTDAAATAKPTQPIALKLQGNGQGNLNAADIQALTLRLGKATPGTLAASGRVGWSPAVDWRLDVDAQKINPALFHPAIPGELGMQLSSTGQIPANQGIQARIDLKQLQGELRGYPVRANGQVDLNGENLTIPALELNTGDNQVQISGSLGQAFDLDWQLDAPKLAQLWPDLSGALQGRGVLKGTLQAPQIQAKLHGENLGYQQNRLAKLDLDAQIGAQASQPLLLDLAANNLSAGELQWQALKLQTQGTRAKHQIALELEAGKNPAKQAPQASVRMAGGLDSLNHWRGQLQDLTLQLQGLGLDLGTLDNWRLQAPTPLELGAQQQKLGQLCLLNQSKQTTRLCGKFQGAASSGWQASLSVPGFPLQALQTWLPDGATIKGDSNLQADFRADAKGHIQGQADLNLPRGDLQVELAGEQQRLDFSGGLVKALLDTKGADLNLQLPVKLGAEKPGGIRGNLQLPGFNPAQFDTQRQALRGTLQADLQELGLVSVVAPDIKNVKGRIAADFKLSGTLANPKLQGSADLLEGAVDIPLAGLELRELALKLTTPDLDRVQIQGGVRSGTGKLDIQGETRLQAQQGFPTRIQIKGQDWTALNTPEAELHIAPKLTITHDQSGNRLDGEVLIPYARIRPRELPAGAVSDSNDLVVVGAGRKTPTAKTDPNFRSSLRIRFGERVSFEGFGLRARLSGDLSVIDEPRRPVLGRGRVGIAEGTYQAYGQNLKIQRGYVLFADSPVDNPGLDVSAVREAGDVTAGLRVGGTLKKPKLDLFSTPSLPDSQILSYLLTGSANGNTGNQVSVNAALAASGVSSLGDEVGRQLGLEEFRVDTGNGLASASVVAGTYLSPRLYVQYVNQLASRETALKLRYDLTNKVQIQTESGKSQGVDVFYTIER